MEDHIQNNYAVQNTSSSSSNTRVEWVDPTIPDQRTPGDWITVHEIEYFGGQPYIPFYFSIGRLPGEPRFKNFWVKLTKLRGYSLDEKVDGQRPKNWVHLAEIRRLKNLADEEFFPERQKNWHLYAIHLGSGICDKCGNTLRTNEEKAN